MSRSSSDATTIRTVNAPATIVCAPYNPTIRRRSRSTANVRKPAPTSRRNEPRSVRSALSKATGRMPAIITADHTKLSALTAKTVSAFVAARRMPPSAGPTNVPMLSTVEEVTLAALSSAGVRASDGSSAACAGRKAVPTTLASPTAAYTIAAGPSQRIVSATTTISGARIRSVATMTRSRGKRSAKIATNGAASADGSSLITPTSPTAAAPPSP
jgi:hypothetical protein